MRVTPSAAPAASSSRRRHDAGGADRPLGRRLGLIRLGRLRHQAEQVEDAGAEDDEVDHDEGMSEAPTAAAAMGAADSAVRNSP